MPKIKDVVAVVGSYVNKEGENKKEYMNVGSILETEKGQFLVLKAVPAPRPDKNGNPVWFFNLYDPQARERSAEPKQAKPATQDPSDDIPFN